MLNNGVFFIILICPYIINCDDWYIEEGRNETLDEYLLSKLNQVEEAVTTSLGEVKIYSAEITERQRLYGSYSCVFTVFDDTFLFMDNVFYHINIKNNAIQLDKIHEYPIRGIIEFTKFITYNGTGYFLVKSEEVIDILVITKEEIYLMHAIKAPLAVDAAFFISGEYLLLIIVNNDGDKETPTRVYGYYEWAFYELMETMTTGAVKVTTFTAGNNLEIFIILQHSMNEPLHSFVYELDGNSLFKMQRLETTQPIAAETFTTDFGLHLVIFEKSGNNRVYTWDGRKFIRLFQFWTDTVAVKPIVIYPYDTPVVIFLMKNQLQPFRLFPKGIKAIGEVFKTNYSAIIDIHSLKSKNITYLVGLNETGLYISAVSFHIQITGIKNPVSGIDALKNCFNYLETNVYQQRRKLEQTNDILSQVKDEKDSTEDNSIAKYEDDLNNLKSRLANLQSLLKKYEDMEGNNLIIENDVVIKGVTKAVKLIGKNIEFKKINGKNWQPDQWLRHNISQEITGPSTIDTVKVSELYTTNSDPLFRGMLTKTGDHNILGGLEVSNLKVNKTSTKKINGITVENIYLRSDPQPVQGLKTFENLKAIEAKVNLLNGEPTSNGSSLLNADLEKYFELDNNLEVENLEADFINGVNWSTFRDNVFRVGITKEINGDLTFPEFKTNRLILKTIKGGKVDDLLTTSTDQIIDADMVFSRTYAENIITNKTNDIKLSESVIQYEDNTLVEVPIKFDKLYVRGDLELIGELDEEFFLRNGEHIIGTNESDLLQKYDGMVKINGNLYVNNMMLQPEAKIFIGNEQFDPNITNTYWTKHTKQSIPVHFKAQNGISVPHLITNNVNGVDFNKYMLNKDRDTLKTSYQFKNISVVGDIYLNNSSTHIPDLIKLNEDAVRVTGNYYIDGKKRFTNTLRVENLITDNIDGVAVNDTLTSKSEFTGTGRKSFNNIVVKGNMTCDMQSLRLLNGVNITQFLENVIYIDEPKNFDNIDFKNISVEDLWVAKLNGHRVNDHISNIENILSADHINILTVNGSVTLNNAKGVSKINDIDFEKLVNNNVKIGKYGGILINLEFNESVKVGDLRTNYINDINMRDITKRLFYRNLENNVTAPYTFKNIKTENIVVPKINNISMKNLINVLTTAPQTIHANGRLEFSSANLKKSLNAITTTPCDLVEALKKIRNPPSKDWESVEVKGNAKFLDPSSTLHRVLEKTVTTNTKNIIQAPVKFSKHVVADNVTSNKHINNVNLQKILNDAVRADYNEEQIITGKKIFSRMSISEAFVKGNTDIPVVNQIEIPKLNEAIVQKDTVNDFVIKGKKLFSGGLQCDRFYSEQVSNIDVDNIVSTNNPRKVPKVAFNSIAVKNNLNISFVNSSNFEKFLKNRILTEGPTQTVSGVYYFNNLQAENIETPAINSIKINNVVFDADQNEITAPKYFTETVEVFGNLTCEYINGINFSNMIQKSAAFDDDVIFNGSMTLLRPSLVNGNINTEYINSYPVDHIKKVLDQGTILSETEKIYDIQTDIADKIKRNIEHVKFLSSDYMYIEKSQELQIPIPNTLSAKTMESNGHVLIHIIGEEPGPTCGLTESCKCPAQYSIEFSPQHSVTIFPHKGTERIYSYEEEGMIIHLLTNSLSTNSKCRSNSTNAMNEVSALTWANPIGTNMTGEFYEHNEFVTGYISGAEFFTLHGQTYAIIGRYYSHDTDSHDLGCYVLKFTEDKTKVKEIQQIPTTAAWSLNLFHTAQGVTLVIGNIRTINAHHADEETQIYRFDESTEKFNLLRVIPSYGCSMAAGVVLGSDSLIVLAHRYAPLQVLKYNSYVDNYYFYQSFELDAPAAGISVFYTGGFGISDAYLCIVTSNENYFIYSFKFIEGWKLESSGELEGLRNLIPFELNKQSYLFAPSSKSSSLLNVVKHGSV